MRNTNSIITLVLKAVALGMAVASLVLGILGTVTVETMVTLLSIGLLALALEALQSGPEPE
jgi:hypothetical protein